MYDNEPFYPYAWHAEQKTATTVAELIAVLQEYSPQAGVHSIELPFNGVVVVPQINGQVLIAPIRE